MLCDGPCTRQSEPDALLCACSIKEPGLYDYIIFNDDVEEAFRQLASVAERALRGQVWRPCCQP